ncbi:MAG: autoinducer binding domain-containing protein [Pseudomonadota bacterium]
MKVDNIDIVTEIATAGYAIAVNLGPGSVDYSHSTYPGVWQELYVKEGLHFGDPIIIHAMRNEPGKSRWSEIAVPDSMNVLERAHQFGMRFGAVVWLPNARGFMSILTAARSDREFSDAELEALETSLKKVVET